ncbi:hypothetical protein ACCAA_400077 [Candidatus Accumulibacter aalborgensis]|uniref:Uncharacterized protein n=1 Tax=Candidatus Accumulibacter aalborgensis TaxID=1860102 RepID=A0A1A8XRX5_9PROT|nr:hypothetical protein [Candidatus Accumulibacter aalborgensis]SBT07237.1 hypothetical protein ACCAA_400077 [Candidatus Accumulibacter aalborgensis]
MRQGAIDPAIGSTMTWSPQVKELDSYAMPFLTQYHAGLDASTSGEVAKEVFALNRCRGFVGMTQEPEHNRHAGVLGFGPHPNLRRLARPSAPGQGKRPGALKQVLVGHETK